MKKTWNSWKKNVKFLRKTWNSWKKTWNSWKTTWNSCKKSEIHEKTWKSWKKTWNSWKTTWNSWKETYNSWEKSEIHETVKFRKMYLNTSFLTSLGCSIGIHLPKMCASTKFPMFSFVRGSNPRACTNTWETRETHEKKREIHEKNVKFMKKTWNS